MTYATHRYLGTLLFPELRDRWNIRLDEKAFLYGCVKPDVSSLFIRHPHFWKISKRFAFKRLAKLCRRRPKPGKAHKGFSEELGVALHYVADFFTAVHNLTPNPIRAHIEFEKVLHEAFLSAVRADTVAGYFNFRDRLADESAESGAETRSRDISRKLLHEISRRHADYEPDRANPEKDIHPIVGASVLAAAAVMDAVSINIDAASPRPAPLPESLPDPVLRESVPGIADFR